jgi:hypothetical protein
LKFLLFHLKNNEIYIKKEILWVLSNIAGGNSNHVKFLFFSHNSGLNFFINEKVSFLLNYDTLQVMKDVLLMCKSDEMIQREICYLMMNLTCDTNVIQVKNQFSLLFNQDILDCFNGMLMNGDVEVQFHILTFLNFLNFSFGNKELVGSLFSNSLKELKNHESMEILKLLENF